MNDFNQPPIPDPFQQQPVPQLQSRDWQSAPSIVKGWAYPLTWLGIIILPLVIIGTLAGGFNNVQSGPLEGIITSVLYGILLVVDIWLNRALKKGIAAAWTVQLIISVLGLCGFPIGTMIHGYILSQWSKPEVKAWFGMS